MKHSFLVLSFLLAASVLMAQESQEKTKQKEIGIVFSSLNNFGFLYKTGTETALWRFGASNLSLQHQTEEQTDVYKNINNSLGISLRIGREYRKPLTDNFILHYGADVVAGFTQSKYENTVPNQTYNDVTNEQSGVSFGADFVFGFNYLMGSTWQAGLELLPGISYYSTDIKATRYTATGDEVTKVKNSGYKFNISNNSVMLSLAYRLK